jgi:signal transduction histidine kinase
MRLHHDGSHLPTEIMAKISSYGGDVANIGICRDISERVQLERKTREAEKLNALAQLAASLAHEIRNPLTAIKMNVQMLSESSWPRKDDRKLIDSTLGEVEQIRRAITEMMDLTVPFRLKHRWVDTRWLLEGCLRIIGQRMKYQGVTASMRLCSELNEMYVDPTRIEQAVVNLLLNALEVLPRGGRIFMSTRIVQNSGRRWGEIRIGDNGPGVPKEKLPYLFDAFHSEKAGGIGLGLANVKKIVGAHGGEVIVTPRRPTGVSFRLRLPQKWAHR